MKNGRVLQRRSPFLVIGGVTQKAPVSGYPVLLSLIDLKSILFLVKSILFLADGEQRYRGF